MSSIFDYVRESPKKKEAPLNTIPEQKFTSSIFQEASKPLQQEPVSQQIIPQKQNSQEFPFEGENDLEREIERHQGRLTSRFFEGILGLPGDLQQLAQDLLGPKVSSALVKLPTSSQLQQTSEKLTKGFTSPKNELEKKGDEFIRDVASFATPGGVNYNFARNLGIPIAANLGKEVLKGLGADEKDSTYAKIGTMFALDLLSGGGVKKLSSSLFEQAKKNLPKGLRIPAKEYEDSLINLEKSLQSGGSRPSTNKALEKISEARSQIKNGTIDANWLFDNRQAINESILEAGGFDIKLPKVVKQKIIKNLNEVKSAGIDALESYGEKSNPQFLEPYKKANESYSAYASSNVVSNFLKKHFGNFLANKTSAVLFGLAPGAIAAPLHGVAAGTLATGATGGVAAGLQGTKILYRMAKSPTLRKYYSNVVKGALAGNVSQVKANLSGLEKGLKDQEQKRKDELKRLVEES